MKKWQQKEKDDARTFRGVRQKGSGNTWGQPGDIKSDNFLIDSKQTEKTSYSVSKKTWDKLYEEALFAFRIPILSLLIQDLELIVLSKEDFLKLTEKLESS